MAKKKENAEGSKPPTFEASLAKLEQIVLQLEQGDIGLADAMTHYEEGVKLLSACYKQLEKAEARIELLRGVDAEGNPVTEAFDDNEEDSLDEKASARSGRRTAKRPAKQTGKSPEKPKSTDAGDVDTSGSLF